MDSPWFPLSKRCNSNGTCSRLNESASSMLFSTGTEASVTVCQMNIGLADEDTWFSKLIRALSFSSPPLTQPMLS